VDEEVEENPRDIHILEGKEKEGWKCRKSHCGIFQLRSVQRSRNESRSSKSRGHVSPDPSLQKFYFRRLWDYALKSPEGSKPELLK
jgi:hypothetical protein